MLAPVSYGADFEEMVKDLVEDKIGNQYSLNLNFDKSKKYEDIIANQDRIKSVSLTMFSVKPKGFKALVIFDEPISKKVEIYGKFDAYFEVYVATRYIRFGENLVPGDIKIMKAKRLKNGEQAVRNLPDILGMQAKFNIKAGQIIKKADLKNPEVIKENDPVTIMYSNNDITLKTLGIALGSGAVGEKVRVKNDKTGIIVFGEIINKNVVKVNSSDK